MDKTQVILEIILLLLTLAGVVYKVAQSERRIYETIDAQKDVINERFNGLEKRLDLQISAQEHRKELVDYIVHGLDEKINHKFHRLQGSLNDVQGFLTRTSSFRKREIFDKERDDERTN